MSVAPISTHHGGANIGALAGPEREVAQIRLEKQTRALYEEPPNREVSPTARIFRIPRLKGYTHIDKVKRRVTDKDGNEIEPQSDVTVRFTPCSVAIEHGEIILDPEVQKDADGQAIPGDEKRAAADKERIEIIEALMRHPKFKHLGIFDFHKARQERLDVRDAELAKELLNPARLEKIVAAGKKLGLAVEDGMSAALRKLAPQKPAGGEKPSEKAKE